jgi:hypothetical protein
MKPIEVNADGSDIELVQQRSRLFRFPDFISVRFLPLGDDRSTLIVYSRTKYGRRDFSVNRRLDFWLAAPGAAGSAI